MSQTHFRSGRVAISETACGITHYECTRDVRLVTCPACRASAAFNRMLANIGWRS